MDKKRLLKETITKDEEGYTQQNVKEFCVPQEPPFVKLYLDDIAKVNGLTGVQLSILFYLIKTVSYANAPKPEVPQGITLIAATKNQIAESLSISVETVNKAIQEFHKKGILLRKERALWILNPMLFGKGSWKDIYKIRYEVRYSPEGKEQYVQFLTKEEDEKGVSFEEKEFEAKIEQMIRNITTDITKNKKERLLKNEEPLNKVTWEIQE